MNLCIIISVIFILLVILILHCSYKKISYPNPNADIEDFININKLNTKTKFKRNTCKYNMNETLRNVLHTKDIKESSDKNSHLVFPCTYDYIDKEINMMDPPNENQRVFIIHNADRLAAKNGIWECLVNEYGREGASEIMPMTYLLYKSEDLDLFDKEFNPNETYILKSNVQRQEGLKLSNNKSDILNGSKEGYVVVQKLLQNPFCISGMKTNFRVYILAICQGNERAFYAHEDGFVYYTKKSFVKNTLDRDINITSGYIDRKVYETNPLTLRDLRKYLEQTYDKKTSEMVFYNIYSMLTKVSVAVADEICNHDKLKKCITFQMFGADVALSDDFGAQLHEYNKGPDISPKDERDGRVKFEVMNDVFTVLKLNENNGEDHHYIKLMETDNDKIISYF